MDDIAAKKTVKTYSLSKDDLNQVYARLNIAAYFTALVNKDCYTYLREIVFTRLQIPKNWAIIHADDWKTITVIDPQNIQDYGIAITTETQEAGSISSGVEEKKPDPGQSDSSKMVSKSPREVSN